MELESGNSELMKSLTYFKPAKYHVDTDIVEKCHIFLFSPKTRN